MKNMHENEMRTETRAVVGGAARRALIRLLMAAAALALAVAVASPAMAKKGQKSRFYDFSDQLIDGVVKKPSTIWMEARQRAKFDRLLSLKKSFREAMIATSKEPILK